MDDAINEQVSEPVAPAAKTKSRMRGLAFGVMAISAVGIYGAFAQAVSMSHTPTTEVARLVQPLARGQVLDKSSVEIIQLPSVIAGDYVSASNIRSLYGAKALSDFPKGALLAPSSFGEITTPAGVALVGLNLAKGSYPEVAVAAGMAVGVVDTTDSAGAGVVLDPIAATAVGASRVTTTGIHLDVYVPIKMAAYAAKLAAKSNAALVLLPVKN